MNLVARKITVGALLVCLSWALGRRFAAESQLFPRLFFLHCTILSFVTGLAGLVLPWRWALVLGTLATLCVLVFLLLFLASGVMPTPGDDRNFKLG